MGAFESGQFFFVGDCSRARGGGWDCCETGVWVVVVVYFCGGLGTAQGALFFWASVARNAAELLRGARRRRRSPFLALLADGSSRQDETTL
jgi:hypothetical protein